MTNSDKPLYEWIDKATYRELLGKWRHSPISEETELFSGDVGEYYAKVMLEKKNKLSIRDQVRVSKSIGWN